MRDFVYPEAKIPHGKQQIKIVPDMWSRWKEDTNEDLMKSFMYDAESDEFTIENFIRKVEDAQLCMKFLREHLRELIIY